MKKISFLLTVILLCSVAIAQPARSLFEYELREGDTQPKPELTLNKASLRSRERKGEGSAKGGWQPNGIVVCDTSDVHLPKISSDGIYGAVVVWYEVYRGADSVNHANYDIYAQRVDSMGNLKWQSQGVPVCSLSTSGAWRPAIVPDGSGGVIISWAEWGRDSTGYEQVYAQRLDSMGNRLWPENGITVCSQWSGGGQVAMAGDGAGGAVIAWVDGRYSADGDIFAQRIDSLGNPVWQVDGVPVCTASAIQWDPGVALNTNKSSFITWREDYRNGSVNDVYAQLVDSLGNCRWDVDGKVIVADSGDQRADTKVLPNKKCGGIIGWWDFVTDYAYVQYLDSLGNMTWLDTGVWVGQFNMQCSDNNDGALLCTGSFAQRIDQTGTLRWGSGVSLHAGSSAGHYDACADGFGGVIAFWDDYRADPPYGLVNQYMQRVDSSGNLLWNPTGVPACTLKMNVETYLKVAPDGVGGGYGTWFGIYVGSQYYPQYEVAMVQRVNPSGVPGGVCGNTIPDIKHKDDRLALKPNPFKERIYLEYSLAKPTKVTMNIYNLTGQVVRTIVDEHQQAGYHRNVWNGKNQYGGKVSAGIYFVNLSIDGNCINKKILMIK